MTSAAQVVVISCDARTGTRTRTPLRGRDFKSLASTRFATRALTKAAALSAAAFLPSTLYPPTCC